MTHPKRRAPTTPPVLTVPEAAQCCGVTSSTIRRWLAYDDDPLPSRTIGQLTRVVMPADLAAWSAKRGQLLLLDPSDVAKPWPRRDRS